MVRYTLFVLAVVGSAATAVASINPANVVDPARTTVVEKNQFWPIDGELVIQPCGVEDCSDTPQNT